MFVVFWREYPAQGWQPQAGFPTQAEADSYVATAKWEADKCDVPICYRGEYCIVKCQLVYNSLPV